jgi:hypothetical protein
MVQGRKRQSKGASASAGPQAQVQGSKGAGASPRAQAPVQGFWRELARVDVSGPITC